MTEQWTQGRLIRGTATTHIMLGHPCVNISVSGLIGNHDDESVNEDNFRQAQKVSKR